MGHRDAALAVAPGDLLVPVERALGRLRATLGPPQIPPAPVVSLGSRWYGVYARREPTEVSGRLESTLTRWITAGVLATLLAAGLYGVLALRRARRMPRVPRSLLPLGASSLLVRATLLALGWWALTEGQIRGGRSQSR